LKLKHIACFVGIEVSMKGLCNLLTTAYSLASNVPDNFKKDGFMQTERLIQP
jgi:hypothetical protein